MTTALVLSPAGVVQATDVPGEGTHARKRFDEMLASGYRVVDVDDVVEKRTRRGGVVLVMREASELVPVKSVADVESTERPRKKVATKKVAANTDDD